MNTVALSEVAKINMGQSPLSESYNKVGDGLPFFQGKTDFGDVYPKIRVFCTSPNKIAEANDILLSVRAPVGSINICKTKSCIGRGLAAIRGKSEIEQKYLYFFLKFYEPELEKAGKGSTFEAVNREDVEKIEIPLPSLDEQKRITAILEKADRLRRQRRFVQTLSDSFLQSIFIKMFGDIFQNEKDFEVGEIGQKLSFMTSGSRGWAEHYTAKGDLFLRIQNVNKGELLLNDIAFVQAPDTAEARRTKVKEGDVLLTITAALGRSAIIPKNLPTAYINQHIALLRVKDINPTFVSHFITSKSGQIQIERLDREGVKSGLNFDDIKGINILMPPLPLQEKFAEIVKNFERVRRQQREAARQAEHLFQTLLHRAFRGEL